MVGIRALASPSSGADSDDRMDRPQHAPRWVNKLLRALPFKDAAICNSRLVSGRSDIRGADVLRAHAHGDQPAGEPAQRRQPVEQA